LQVRTFARHRISPKAFGEPTTVFCLDELGNSAQLCKDSWSASKTQPQQPSLHIPPSSHLTSHAVSIERVPFSLPVAPHILPAVLSSISFYQSPQHFSPRATARYTGFTGSPLRVIETTVIERARIPTIRSTNILTPSVFPSSITNLMTV
jgi:hypothetical protein